MAELFLSIIENKIKGLPGYRAETAGGKDTIYRFGSVFARTTSQP